MHIISVVWFPSWLTYPNAVLLAILPCIAVVFCDYLHSAAAQPAFCPAEKGIVTNLPDGRRNPDGFQTVTAGKSLLADAAYSLRNHHIGQRGTAVKGTVTDFRQPEREIELCQRRAACKAFLGNNCQTQGYLYGGQPFAVGKGTGIPKGYGLPSEKLHPY